MAEVYNMVPNVLWTALNLAPVFIFCYMLVPIRQTGTILFLAMLTAFLPWRWYGVLQLGKDVQVYRKVGILIIRKYSQDGDLINSLLRRKYPHYRVIRNASQNDRYIQRSYMFERYHVAVCAAMLAFTVYALYLGQYGWAVAITLNNILYNVYPIWLQQYNRLRLRGVLKRRS